jgi:hypothetical protein
MNKGVWFAAGAAAGVYVSARVRRMAEAVTVDGIHDRLSGLFAGARVFGDEVRAGIAEKETQLRDQLAARLPGEDAHGRDGAGADHALQRGRES